MLDGVGDDETAAVGAEGPSLRQKGGKPFILLGVVGGAGVHHAKSVALHLLGQKAQTVIHAAFVPVGGQQRRAGQGIHRVGDHAEESPEPGLPRLAGVQLHQSPVGLELGHPHILHAAAHGGDALGRHKEKRVAVEKRLLGHDLHRGHGVILPRQRHLIQLKLPALGGGLVDVADADGGHRVAAQQLQPHGDGAAHITDGQNVDALFARLGLPCRHLPPAGMVEVHRPQAAGQPFRRLNGRRLGHGDAAAVQPRHVLPRRRQLGKGRGGEGGPAALRGAAVQKDGLALGGLRRRQGQRLAGHEILSVFLVLIHDGSSFYRNRFSSRRSVSRSSRR